MSTTEAIRLQLRSWPEVEAYLGRCKGVIVPWAPPSSTVPPGPLAPMPSLLKRWRWKWVAAAEFW